MTKDDLHAFLRSRRSIRRFKPDPVPHDCIQRILETAIYAPSAHNLQPWRFAVITGSAAKSRLAEAITARFRQDMIVDGVPEADIQARVDADNSSNYQRRRSLLFFAGIPHKSNRSQICCRSNKEA